MTCRVASDTDKRVALICSADQGHGHHKDGPYGFAPTSASYDRAYCRAVANNDMGRMLYWRPDWIESALPDSYWQTVILHGALRTGSMGLELHSYEAPTYFGMACASSDPASTNVHARSRSKADSCGMT